MLWMVVHIKSELIGSNFYIKRFNASSPLNSLKHIFNTVWNLKHDFLFWFRATEVNCDKLHKNMCLDKDSNKNKDSLIVITQRHLKTDVTNALMAERGGSSIRTTVLRLNSSTRTKEKSLSKLVGNRTVVLSYQEDISPQNWVSGSYLRLKTNKKYAVCALKSWLLTNFGGYPKIQSKRS